MHAWEITGYNSATPTATATAQNTDNTSFSKVISLSTQYNGCTIGSGVTEDTSPAGSVTVSNSDSLQQIDLESATNHFLLERSKEQHQEPQTIIVTKTVLPNSFQQDQL